MDYRYDVFISYRRHSETQAWIKKHFLPLLDARLGFELERKPQIYVDYQLESGASWPAALGAALGASRMLIPLWTADYLSSVWCAEELSHMLVREQKAKLRTSERPHGVILPVFVHDGDRFPADLQHIEPFQIQEHFNLRMAHNSPRAEELDAALMKAAPGIANCVRNAPAWRKGWPKKAASQFFDRFYQRSKSVQITVPRFTGR